jgi:hypothetical protein
MDFWGFESRQGMPGDGFGLFENQPVTIIKGNKKVEVEVPITDDGRVSETERQAVEKAARANGIEGEFDADWLEVWDVEDKTKAEGQSVSFPAENSEAGGDQPQAGEGSQADSGGGENAENKPATVNTASTPAGEDTTNENSSEENKPATVNTASTPAGGAGNPTPQPNDIQQWTQTMNQVAGFIGSVGNVGVASQYAGLAFGGGYGAANFSYSDPFNSFNGGVAGYGDPIGFGGYGGYDVGISGGFDLSGTSFYAMGDCYEMKRKARQIEMMINQLWAMICQGNVDAIEGALILMNLKSKTTLIDAAKQMILAMREYEKQMNGLTDEISKIAGKPQTDGGAQLQLFSSKMQGYSMGRQAVTNSVRDIMTMVEEFSNLESSILARKERDVRYTQWA